MPENTKVYQAILKARIKFGPVLKLKKNEHFKSRYADLQAVLDAVEDALAESNLLLLQRTECDERGVRLVTELVEVTSGEKIASVYPLNPAQPNNPQALGGALTYARRYAALALLGLAPEDDDGQQGSRPKPQQQQKPAPAPAQQQPEKKPAPQRSPQQGSRSAVAKLERPPEDDQDPAELLGEMQVAYLRQELAASKFAWAKEAKVFERFQIKGLGDLCLADYRLLLDNLHKQEAA